MRQQGPAAPRLRWAAAATTAALTGALLTAGVAQATPPAEERAAGEQTAGEQLAPAPLPPLDPSTQDEVLAEASEAAHGHPVRPSAGDAQVEEELRAADSAATRPTFAPGDYRSFGLGPRADVPLGEQAYWGAVTERADDRPHDSAGVRMYELGGRLYDHPVGQAGYGLENLSTYVITDDRFFLDRAVAQAERLVERRVVSDDAWYFPYPFDFALHGLSHDVRSAPWYSGMAQGQALSLFSRLHTVTGEARWRTAADAAFASLLQQPSTEHPWVSQVDADGMLWLEEYPNVPASRSDWTFNGHMFATYGVYDYWLLTGSEVAAAVFDGASTTTRYYVDDFRRTSWRSVYCLEHEADGDKYHQIHVVQLLLMQSLTGDYAFARYADAYRNDYPKEVVSGRIALARGTWTAYTFDREGRVTGSRSLRLSRSSSTTGDRRQRIKGRGIYYRVTAGSLAGYWLPERYGSSFMMAKAAENVYAPVRRANFAPGTYSAYHFDSLGRPVRPRTMTLTAPSTAHFDRSAWFSGRLYVHMVDGTMRGRWLAQSAVTND